MFYQTSDKVEQEVIRTVTQECERDDCCLSARIEGTTLAATSEFYDKSGKLIVYNSNDKIIKVCCRKCWKHWEVEVIQRVYSKKSI